MQQNDKNGNAQTFGWPLAVSAGVFCCNTELMQEHYNGRVFPPASYHHLHKVFKSVLVLIFPVDIFMLIIFRLWSISLMMTDKGEISKTLKMDFFKKKCMISHSNDDQSAGRTLNWAPLVWIERGDRDC